MPFYFTNKIIYIFISPFTKYKIILTVLFFLAALFANITFRLVNINISILVVFVSKVILSKLSKLEFRLKCCY